MSPRLPSNAPAMSRDPTVPSEALRRALPLLASCAALVCAVPAAARLEPVRHAGPRVHIGTFPFHTGGATRIRVVARLGLPPLTIRRLALHGAASRADLSAVSAQQTRAARQIRAAIPQARIGRRFQIVLNALTVSLPASQLPMLVRQPSVTKVYPSVTYTLALDRSPSIIG